jgi:hypothetical protein
VPKVKNSKRCALVLGGVPLAGGIAVGDADWMTGDASPLLDDAVVAAGGGSTLGDCWRTGVGGDCGELVGGVDGEFDDVGSVGALTPVLLPLAVVGAMRCASSGTKPRNQLHTSVIGMSSVAPSSEMPEGARHDAQYNVFEPATRTGDTIIGNLTEENIYI